ncbi:MAG: 4-hydroxy-tetrahydrodipicolinate reductase [Hyphomicrobiales bacterium]
MSIPILLYGASGRMGHAIREALADSSASDLALRACVAPVRADGAFPDGCRWLAPDALQKPNGLASLPADLVVIDVSLAAGTERLLDALERSPRALVSATTGLEPRAEERVRALGKTAAVLRAPNLSLGIAVVGAFLRALPKAARTAFDADILEHHHAGKKDAPSGTALSLAATLGPIGTSRRADRNARFHSIRAGTVPGTHEVVLSGEGETVTLVHRVEARRVFALGALRAARFLHGRPAGCYTIDDTLT